MRELELNKSHFLIYENILFVFQDTAKAKFSEKSKSVLVAFRPFLH